MLSTSQLVVAASSILLAERFFAKLSIIAVIEVEESRRNSFESWLPANPLENPASGRDIVCAQPSDLVASSSRSLLIMLNLHAALTCAGESGGSVSRDSFALYRPRTRSATAWLASSSFSCSCSFRANWTGSDRRPISFSPYIYIYIYGSLH